MTSRHLIHFVGSGLACAQLAYWTIQLMAPLPDAAPARVRAVPAHDPDPVLLARAFGQIELAAPAVLSNIRVAGVYAGGPDSAAVFLVEGGPAKAVRLGEEVAPGSTLVEVDAQSVTLDSAGVRRQLHLPNPTVATSSRPAAHRDGSDRRRHISTMPTVAARPAPRPVGERPSAAVVPARPEPKPEPAPKPSEGREAFGTAASR
jgi:general secretion pathway protein C